MRALIAAALIAFVASAPTGAFAVNPDEVLANPVLEKRARVVSKQLRCLVCQNQSIDDSNADLARDLRLLVRERIKAGDTNEQVIDYVVSRYGDFVLLKPPFKARTVLLWAGPGLVLIGGVIALAVFFRRRRRAGTATGPAPLSAAEQRRLEELLDAAEPGDKKS